MTVSRVIVTGSQGFIGQHVVRYLTRRGITVVPFIRGQNVMELGAHLGMDGGVIHLAGVNRPSNEAEFQSVNVDLTRGLVDFIDKKTPGLPCVLVSSIQAGNGTPYGRSKEQAETIFAEREKRHPGASRIFRLPNVFGKWSRPHYNSVVATFCAEAAAGKSLTIHDPASPLRLVYIDAVVEALVSSLEGGAHGLYRSGIPEFHTSVGQVAAIIEEFARNLGNVAVPDVGDELTRLLHSTFISFVKPTVLKCQAEVKRDDRGWLAEIVKSQRGGQIFVSETKPGVVRGQHYHETKIEKFIVVRGQGRIRFRSLKNGETWQFDVMGDQPSIVDIPPGVTHSIENTGNTEMTTLFWASEVFDVSRPDTYREPV